MITTQRQYERGHSHDTRVHGESPVLVILRDQHQVAQQPSPLEHLHMTASRIAIDLKVHTESVSCERQMARSSQTQDAQGMYSSAKPSSTVKRSRQPRGGAEKVLPDLYRSPASWRTNQHHLVERPAGWGHASRNVTCEACPVCWQQLGPGMSACLQDPRRNPLRNLISCMWCPCL
jgi:hypothetical protein